MTSSGTAAKLRVLVTGGTGSAGSEVLRQCIASPAVEHVTSLSRRPPPVEPSPKLTVILHKDFLDYSSVLPQLRESRINACLWCLGISTSQVKAKEYEVLTYDYTVAAATALAALYPPGPGASPLRFCFLSGAGADSTEQSRVLFSRVKGRAENALLTMTAGGAGAAGGGASAVATPAADGGGGSSASTGGLDVYCFRPGYIHPAPGMRPDSNPGWMRLADKVLAPLFHACLPSQIISTVDLARAIIDVAAQGHAGSRILENNDLRKIAAGVASQYPTAAAAAAPGK